jgi:hypothetical protein
MIGVYPLGSCADVSVVGSSPEAGEQFGVACVIRQAELLLHLEECQCSTTHLSLI